MANQQTMVKTSSTTIVNIPTDKIVADYSWNSRSIWEKGGEGKGHSYADLVASIGEKGQTDAVDVISMPKKPGFFKLVTGFRRYSAITENKIPTVKCIVRDYDEAEARLRNITENTERDELRGSDTCWAIGQYLASLPGNKPEPTQEELAKKFGLSQSYVSKHLQILKKVDPKLIQAWREGLPLNAKEGAIRQELGLLKFLLVAQVDKPAQEEQYNLLLGIGKDGQPAKKEADPVDKAMKEAKRVGELLGRLVKAEVIEQTGDLVTDLESFVPSASGLPKSAKQQVAGALALAFQQGQKPEEAKKEEKGNGSQKQTTPDA